MRNSEPGLPTHVLHPRAGARRAIVAIALLLASCTPDARTLTVDVRTDWLPGLEFDAVRTTLGTGTGDRFTPSAGTYSVAATDRQDFGEGRRVAEINGLEAGQLAVRVELLTGGATLATRDTIVDLSGSFSLIVLITSSCADVECPGPTDPPENIECNGGYCVDPRCSPEQPELCDPGCTSDTECPTTSECTTGSATRARVCSAPTTASAPPGCGAACAGAA